MISPLYGQLSPLRIPTSSRFISADADGVVTASGTASGAWSNRASLSYT